MTSTYVYETVWRCIRCEKQGTITLPFSEGCQTLWDQVVEAHAIASPDCYGEGGIAIGTANKLLEGQQ